MEVNQYRKQILLKEENRKVSCTATSGELEGMSESRDDIADDAPQPK